MTIQNLQKYRWADTSPNSGRPSASMSDLQWQYKFENMRAQTTKSLSRRMMAPANAGGKTAYQGPTQFQQYAAFINDVLLNIRRGSVDYVYFTYQIADLLRFEKDCLRTRFIPEEEFWIVWLDERPLTGKEDF